MRQYQAIGHWALIERTVEGKVAVEISDWVRNEDRAIAAVTKALAEENVLMAVVCTGTRGVHEYNKNKSHLRLIGGAQ